MNAVDVSTSVLFIAKKAELVIVGVGSLSLSFTADGNGFASRVL